MKSLSFKKTQIKLPEMNRIMPEINIIQDMIRSRLDTEEILMSMKRQYKTIRKKKEKGKEV